MHLHGLRAMISGKMSLLYRYNKNNDNNNNNNNHNNNNNWRIMLQWSKSTCMYDHNTGTKMPVYACSLLLNNVFPLYIPVVLLCKILQLMLEIDGSIGSQLWW